MPLEPNAPLPAGTIIKTGKDAEVYISVNGISSAIKVDADSVVELTTMAVHGEGRDAERETVVNVRLGTILGQVKKIAGNSSYEIRSPNGVAAIRGTDFQVSVTALSSGKTRTTFACITGQILVSSDVEGQLVTKLLEAGQAWDPGQGDVTKDSPAVLEEFRKIGSDVSFRNSTPLLPSVVYPTTLRRQRSP